jgi:molybdopterin converting factor small subunit
MIHLRTFARYRERLGFDHLDLELPEPATLAGLLADPRLADLPQEALLAVNESFAERDQVLRDGDQVALMPPVSGG